MGADSIMLNSAASQNESGEDHVDATFDGPSDFEIGFSATALAEIVAAIPGEKIVMQMMDETKKAMLSSADGEGGRYVSSDVSRVGEERVGTCRLRWSQHQ